MCKNACKSCEQLLEDIKQLKEELDKHRQSTHENCELRQEIEGLKEDRMSLANGLAEWQRICEVKDEEIEKLKDKCDRHHGRAEKLATMIQEYREAVKGLAALDSGDNWW
jgi:uncharacterized coiled-coil DUF342 family protein